MKKMQKKRICEVLLVLGLMLVFAGCYSKEEKAQARQYEKQAKKNAVAYIEEKYGFEAEVVSAKCKKTGGDFDPTPSVMVNVTMKYEEKPILVEITGKEESTDGKDNYQREEIVAALKTLLDETTGFPAEKVFVTYGAAGLGNLWDSDNLVGPYFDGSNLKEVLTSVPYGYHYMQISYVNREIEKVDVELIKELTGLNSFEFVDFDSKEHCATITGGSVDVKNNLPYINGYLTTDAKETTYVEYKKEEIDGVLFITESLEETVTVEKRSGFTIGAGDRNQSFADRYKDQLIFGVYAFETDSAKVHVFVPTDKLDAFGESKKPGLVAKGAEKEIHVSSDFSDDKAYIGGPVYTRNTEGPIEFSVYVRKD